MLCKSTLGDETLAICPVESAGTRFALPQRDVIDVLALDDDRTLEQIGGVLSMTMAGGRHRPLISLRDVLCQPSAPTGNVVVMLRVGAQLFGLLVDQVFEPCRAVVLPMLDAAPAFSTFTQLVHLDDGSDVAVLGIANLALSIRRGDTPAALSLAA